MPQSQNESNMDPEELKKLQEEVKRQMTAFLSLPLDKMDKHRCSLNYYRYIQVDMCNEE